MRAIGYSRVSTEEQGKNGISLEVQEAKIRQYCECKEWQLVEIIADCASGKDLERSGLQRLLERVLRREVDAIVVVKLDRLTRSVRDLNILLEIFEKRQVALVSITENLDATNAIGRLMLNLLASVSQWERDIIRERTKLALQHLRSEGRVYSRPVFGFDIRGGLLVANQREQEAVKLMQSLRSQGLPFRAIAKRLEQANIPTKRGGKWDAGTVRKILLNW